MSTQRRLTPLATRAQELRAAVSEVAHESFEGALVVQDPRPRRRRGGPLPGPRRRAARRRTSRPGGCAALFDPLLEALPTLGVLAVLLFGSYRLASGDVTAGELVQVSYLFTLLAFPVRALGWVLGELPRSVVGWTRVQEVLRAEGSMVYGSASLPADRPAELAVTDVSFAYEPGVPVLRDVSFTVEPGRTVAVVGPTGSGKSTLTQLLARLVDPDEGVVAIDGVDVREVERDGVSGAVSLVPQQTFLFDDTVRGNITLGADIGDEKVWAALRLAQADGFVSALPDALDTRIGERGTTLSGGAAPAARPGQGAGPRAEAADPRRRHLQRRPPGREAHPVRPARPARHRHRDRLPHGRRSPWPTTSSTSRTAPSPTTAPTRPCWPAAPATAIS